MNGSFLSIEDFKRIVGDFPWSFPITNDSNSSYLRYKSGLSSFISSLENHLKKVTSKIGCPIYLEKDNRYAQLLLKKDENGNAIISLDPNYYILSNIIAVAKKNIQDQKLFDYNSLFYFHNDDPKSMKSYKRYIKELVFSVLDNLKLIDSNPRFNLRVRKPEKYTSKEVYKLLEFLAYDFDKIIETLSQDICDNQDIMSLIDFDKLYFFIASVTQSDLVAEEIDENSEKFKAYIAILKNFRLYYNIRKQENPEFTQRISYLNNKDFSIEYFIAGIDEILEQVPNLEQYGCNSEEELLNTILLDKNSEYKEERRKKRIAEFEKVMSVSWEFLPSGEKDVDSTGSRRSNRRQKSEEEIKIFQEKIENVLDRKTALFNDSGCVTRFEGINHFEGYVAFVYPNGKVILEKFYNVHKNGTKTIAYNEAIYVMNLSTFLKLSQCSKPEIREFIRKKEEYPDLRVIYHSDNFENRVLGVINGSDYSDEVLDLLDSLVASVKGESKSNG